MERVQPSSEELEEKRCRGNGYIHQSPFFPLQYPSPAPDARHAYIDTFRVWLPHHLKAGVRDALGELDLKMHYAEARDKPPYWCRRYVVALTFHRVHPEIIELLERNSRRATVNGVHLALDLVFAGKDGAAYAGEFINLHMLKPYHRGSVGRYKNTSYYGPRWRRNTWAVYADKEYRHGPGYACHIEARLQGRSTVAERGIEDLRDLLTFDHRRFWERNLKLVAFHRDRLGKRVKGRHLSSAPDITRCGTFLYDRDGRTGDTYLGAAGDATAALSQLRGWGMSTNGILHELDTEPYLP